MQYSMKGLPSPTLGLASDSNNTSSPHKKNIISVVFEQEIDKNPKKNAKSMFEVTSQQQNDDSDEAMHIVPKSNPTVQTYFATNAKITKNFNSPPKSQAFLYEPAKELSKVSPTQFFNETESKTSKFLIKTDGTFEKELKNKIFQHQLGLKKPNRKSTDFDFNKTSRNETSKNYNNTTKDEKEVTLNKETSLNNIFEPSHNNKKIKKSSQTDPSGYHSDSQTILDRETKNLLINGQSQSILKNLLKKNSFDTKNPLSTMKILKTLRPPTTSSIKPDYIATNKLLLQTMSKMNAEKRIKNLQDTFYNQSIAHHDL